MNKQTAVHPDNGIISVLKTNELSLRKLAYIGLSKGSKSQKATYHIIPTIGHSAEGKGKTSETAKTPGAGSAVLLG